MEQITLNKTVFESSEEYIESLIEMEKNEQKQGWKKTVEDLELLKQQKRLLKEIYKGENQKINQAKLICCIF